MTSVQELQNRIKVFEDQQAIRRCMNRYMQLCDGLDADTPLDELASLFTRQAIWEGKGARYENSFGGYRGRDEIRTMFSTYMKTPAHFALNVHFLTSEVIEIIENFGTGRWMMLQTSTFSDGKSHLNAALLNVRFAIEEGEWRIANFQTENLFSRPVRMWNSEAELPVPSE